MAKRDPISLCHWGAFEAVVEDGRLKSTRPWEGSGADPDMIGALPDLVHSSNRVDQPYVREGWLRYHENSDGTGRRHEEFIPVSWETALSLTAAEVRRVRETHGHTSLFAGSYGWSSAGRFHHARTQLRRFFGAVGGFTDQTSNYSWGAAQIILRNVLGTDEAVSGAATSWKSISENTNVFVAFGGLAEKNWRVTSGGAGNFHMPDHVRTARKNGTKFIVVSPMADDIPDGSDAQWIAPRPGSDTAIILALCNEMVKRGRADLDFLASHCSGYDTLLSHLTGKQDGIEKNLRWAATISDVPMKDLQSLADQIETGRVMLTAAWSLQRAHRGEQPYWALIALAAILGQIGLPGGGFSFGYGSLNAVGEGAHKGLIPSLPVLGNENGMKIPVARISDMLEHPGKSIPFDGKQITLPDIRLIYWAGGNPFHHAQDLFRLNQLWTQPETVVVHEQTWTATAMRADIVLPATTSVERNDIGGSSRDPHVFHMPQLIDPVGQARDDYDILSDLAMRLDCEAIFTEDRNADQWLRHLWETSCAESHPSGIQPPDFDALVAMNVWRVPKPEPPEVLLSSFRERPMDCPLNTPSGKIELASPRIASYGYDNISGHPEWVPPKEWIGNATGDQLALLSRQPRKFLHSQLSRTHLAKPGPPEVMMNPQDAQDRDLADGAEVEVSSDRGGCHAVVRISDVCRSGVVVMETGPMFLGSSGGIDHGGNPNALTPDIATSELSQATAAQSCLVRVRSVRKDEA